MFIKQVFHGCTRYKEFLSVFTEGFYKHSPAESLNQSDETLYQIFAYLSYLRLDELATDDFRRLVLSQDASKMQTFMKFAFDV